MPSISRIRFTNVVYDHGHKCYIDTIFRFDGYNAILLLENGAGKTVFVQTLIQAVLPRKSVAQRKIQETLQLSNSAAHIAVEWILEDRPRHYALTAVTLFRNSKDQLGSQEFAMEYTPESSVRLDTLPFVQKEGSRERPATKEEMTAFFRSTAERHMLAHFFSEYDTLQAYEDYIEEHFKLIASEWDKIAAINETEGGVEAYFNNCRTTAELVDRLLIPTVEEGLAAAAHGQQKGNGFAALFESQREHVKQQIRLEKRIGEMQGILAQMQDYTAVKKAQYEAEQELLHQNGLLKAYDQQVRRARAACQQEQETLVMRQQENDAQRQKNREILSACRVAAAEAACEEARAAYEEAKRASDDAAQAYRDNQTMSANLSYARRKQELAQAEGLLAERQRALSLLAADQKTQELAAQLKENGAWLHGWFQQQEQKHEARIQEIRQQRETQKQHEAACQAKQRENHRRQQKLRQEIDSGEGRIGALVAQQEVIEQELFTDAVHQDVDAQEQAWRRELAEVRKNRDDYAQNIAFFEEEGEKAAEQIAEAEKARDEQQQALQARTVALDRVKTAARDVFAELQKWPQCANTTREAADLYRQAEYFAQQIGDAIVMHEKQHNDLDKKRRQAHRWLDLYDGLEAFAADPILLDKIEAWSSEFVFLKSGVEFFQLHVEAVAEKQQEIYARYPFWALSVVVMEEDVPQLQRLLAKEAGDFFEPVFILSEQQARAIVAGETLTGGLHIVAPSHWQRVMQPAAFRDWLDAMREEADRADGLLRENDREWQELSHSLQVLKQFEERYPFTWYREQRDAYQSLQEALSRTQHVLREARRNQEQCRQNAEGFRKKHQEAERRETGLSYGLRQMAQYKELRRQHQEILARNSELLQACAVLQAEEKRLTGELDVLRRQQDALTYDEAGAETRLQEVRHMMYYPDVQQETAVLPQERLSYEALAETRRRLQSQLEGADSSRARLEAQIAQSQADKKRLQKEICEQQRRAETELDETFVYPEDGALREETLLQASHQLKKAQQQAEKECRARQDTYNRQDGQCENERARHEREYGVYTPLVQPFEDVQREAVQQQEVLRKLAAELTAQLQANGREEKALDGLVHQLEIRNEQLGFAREKIPMVLPEKLEEDAGSSELSTRIASCLEQAETAFENAKQRQRAGEKQKNAFILYCEDKVHEERMRRSIVDGLRSKERYEEYLDWQTKSRERLQGAISLFEEERRSHLAHMEHMLRHMILHLQSVCDGLKELASRTRVKVGEAAKDIIMIQLPEWEEAAARTAIRSYLNNLAQELDGDAYHDELGQEDGKKIRDTLEKRLRTQQMLHVVLGNQAVKVRCRKATSGNTFSERPYPWEESNQWSGGETWSKNMALFLGCLNYLSEKRCHIRKAKYNTRVVVADNPFGKASSDHVLSPVFFIAQQLGFQIIALTAHQEGSFIRKYFPVVYSCRFADTADHKSRTVIPEQEVKTAFFEEHHPESLARLNSYDQLGLFD